MKRIIKLISLIAFINFTCADDFEEDVFDPEPEDPSELYYGFEKENDNEVEIEKVEVDEDRQEDLIYKALNPVFESLQWA